jgi:hypothetical protein
MRMRRSAGCAWPIATAKADACPNPVALDQLQTQAPDNAAVWLLKLGEDTRNMKQDAAREDLAKAAAAKLYDDYTGTSLKALADSVGVLPPPADTIDPAMPPVRRACRPCSSTAWPAPSRNRLQITAKLCENAGSDAAIKTTA